MHVAAAVIRDPQGQILIARRPLDKHQGGLWNSGRQGRGR